MVPFAIEDDDSMLRFAPKALVTQEKTRLCREGPMGLPLYPSRWTDQRPANSVRLRRASAEALMMGRHVNSKLPPEGKYGSHAAALFSSGLDYL